MVRSPPHYLARSIGIAVVFALATFGIARPASILPGGLAWLVCIACAASGWGFLVVRAGRVEDVDVGLRIAWGIAGYLAIAGALIGVGICTRPVILALVGIGLAAFAWRELVTEIPIWGHLRGGIGWARAHPTRALGIGVLGVLALVHLSGAVAALDRNPWDDDLAYTPLMKRLLDRGDLIEPFSFRRLGAYGGQPALEALFGARGTLANGHALDRGLCFLVVLLLLLGYARRQRTELVFSVLLVLVLILLPDTTINTAAAWSGVALFVALYRTVALDHWVLAGFVGAGACTLRQNYLAVVVLFLGLVLADRLLTARRASSLLAAWRAERGRWARAAGAGVLALLMWWVAAVRSSATFLYPVLDGTWNDNLSLTPEVKSWIDEVLYLVWASLEAAPLVVVPFLFALLAIARDTRRGRPLTMLFVAVVLGFVLLVHGLVGSEPSHAWRYAFGFGMALTIALVLELGAEDRAVELPALGRWLLLASLLFQMALSRSAVTDRFRTIANDLRQVSAIGGRGDPVASAETRRYAALQAAIPRNAAVAVMLDDPAYLDFARNRLANLDTPGFASPGPGLPSFQGAEPLRRYFLSQGYTHVAFVRSERSRYFFRRPFWVWRYFNDSELFQTMSAYTLDMIDALAELATTTQVLYDVDGLVALDLTQVKREASSVAADTDEGVRRARWMQRLAEREGLRDAWSLTTRHDVRFEDGVGRLQFVAENEDHAWYEAARPRSDTYGPVRGRPLRPLSRRAHLRVRGSGTMRLTLAGSLDLKALHARPRLDVALDGELVATTVATDEATFAVDVEVAADRLRGGWHDVYLVWSSGADPGRDERSSARLEHVSWAPAP